MSEFVADASGGLVFARGEPGEKCVARVRSNCLVVSPNRAGKFRTMRGHFSSAENVALTDRLLCAWAEMVMFKQRSVDCVFLLTSHRGVDRRRGRRLGKGHHIVTWFKPAQSHSIDRETTRH